MHSTRKCVRIDSFGSEIDMTVELGVLRQSWWSNSWPGALGGFLMISLGVVLKRWLPLHFAMGIGGFVAWFVVGLIIARRSQPNYGIPRWVAALIAGVATGLCLGLLSYYFPW